MSASSGSRAPPIGSLVGAVPGLSDSSNEVLKLTEEARSLALAAVEFDKAENYIGAYEYYDKAILNIDEVMSKLPRASGQWMKLCDLRGQYDDRMEQIKELETRKYRSHSVSSDKSTEHSTAAAAVSVSVDSSVGARRRQRAYEEVNFQEMNLDEFNFVEPPLDPVLTPYWLLSNLSKTIQQGGYLTEALFVPKKVWKQSEVKFSGLSAKTAAFELIIRLIDENFASLYFSPDEDSLHLAEEAARNVLEELQGLQNQLAKPFNFIREVQQQQHSPPASEPSSSHGPQSSLPANTGAVEAEKKPATKTYMGFMAALGKNVRKYTEIGLSRLAVALPSKLSNEEFADYTALIVRVCSKVQVAGEWLAYSSRLLQGKILSQHALQLETHSIDSHDEVNPTLPAPPTLNFALH